MYPRVPFSLDSLSPICIIINIYINICDVFVTTALLGAAAPSKPSSKIPVATRRSRVTRSESRYHSEVRHEAVQHALAQAKAQDRANRAPMPSKRKNSLAAKSASQHHNNVYRNLQHGERHGNRKKKKETRMIVINVI